MRERTIPMGAPETLTPRAQTVAAARRLLDAVDWPTVPFHLYDALILCGRRGSEAHGTYVPSTDPTSIDDRDLIGICVLPLSYYLGLQRWEHAEAIKGPWDVVLYDLRKFVHLLTQQNPNVLSALWLEREDYLFVSEPGERLLAARMAFRARKPAYHAFIGYAHGQLKKMTSFGEFKGYMGEKRKRLVERFGFDTKNAAHLIRLLHMGLEYFETGELTVKRTWDRDMLLAIKRGDWRLDQVQREADTYFVRCEQAYERSPLPNGVDVRSIEALQMDLIRYGRPEMCRASERATA